MSGMNVSEEKSMDQEELDNSNFEEKSEEEFIEDMKANIRSTTLKVAQKVNKSALGYMLKQKQWITENNASEAEKFFVDKIPKTLTEELSKALK